MSGTSGIRVLHLFDRYLNIYADRGNIEVLRRRCGWRGLSCDVDGLAIDATFDPGGYDLVYVGGGQDRDQRMIAERMAGAVGAALREAASGGVAMLAVCGGYQLLGDHYLDTGGVRQPGARVLDLATQAGSTRMIGNVAIECDLPPVGSHQGGRLVVAGFENHAGRTTLGADAAPFGRVVSGYGNDGRSGFEGCRAGSVVGTYLHGPLLPRNPRLADWVIAAALAHRHGGDSPELAPIDDALADRAHEVAVARARAERRRSIG